MGLNKKRLAAAAVALVLLIAVFLGIWAANRPSAGAGNKSITVEIVHADGSQKRFEERTDKEFLGPWMLERGLVTEEEYQSGFYTEIDGERAVWDDSAHAYWALYEGEDYAQQGINDTPLVDGGTYRLIYTVGE